MALQIDSLPGSHFGLIQGHIGPLPWGTDEKNERDLHFYLLDRLKYLDEWQVANALELLIVKHTVF